MKENTIKCLVTAALFLAALLSLREGTMAGGFASNASGLKENVEVKVHRVMIDPTTNQPVVILSDFQENRALPIWIGFFEANAIGSEIQGVKHRRPLTHDLLQSIMQQLGLKIQRVVVTHLKESTYYAKIMLEKGHSLMEIDARPSDSIVMALKFKAPIFVSESLFRDRAIALLDEKAVEQRYGLNAQELTSQLAEAFSFGSRRGVLVSDVHKGSLAEKDGIERGDILVEIGGQAIEDVSSLRGALERSKTPVKARVFRKAHFMSITLHPNE